ncbi:MAG TPA: ABC transporter ATP-binding protein [Tepidisphaeraceae bacterium]|nr:ABC transporter ATP-binding protein [Tepidisphaeraceae bacterium]
MPATTHAGSRAASPARPAPVVNREVILRTEHLTKRYGTHTALNDLNLTIHKGEVFGYIGPNGAGKTTTFRILSGLLDPTEGKASIAGEDVTNNKDRIKQLVGFLPDNFGVYPTLKVWEYLDFFAAAYKIPKKARPERIDYCLRIANAHEFRDKLLGALSRGMKQRVGIAKTILHDPAVLILDEPAATIDPRARIEMRRLMRDLANLGKAVLVSSHILPELADVCDTVGILRSGNLAAIGPVQEIMRTVRQKRLMQINVLKFANVAREVLATAPGEWSPVEDDAAGAGDEKTLRYESTADEQQLAQTLLALLKRGIPVTNFSEVPADLEDVFMSLTK